jgi:hypothetical protein
MPDDSRYGFKLPFLNRYAFSYMRHVHCLLITGIFLSTGCKAQELSKSFVSITPGVGIPVGAFASKENNIKSGLAMNGLAINLEYNHFFKRKLGFCLGLKRNVFPLDVDAWTNSNPNATSDPWRVLLVYGGFATRKPIGDKTILSPKVAIGMATSRYPEATIITSNYAINFSSNTGTAPAFIAGATLKYIVTQRIHVAFSLDYFSTAPKFVVTQTVYGGQSIATHTSRYTQNMQAFTAGLSVSYNFTNLSDTP